MFSSNETALEAKIERCIAQRTLFQHKGKTEGILKFKTGDHIHAYGIYDMETEKILPFNRDRHHHIVEDGEMAGEFWYGALVDKKVDDKLVQAAETKEINDLTHDVNVKKGWFPRTAVHISHSHEHGTHFEGSPDTMDVRGLQKAINSMDSNGGKKIDKFEAMDIMKTIDHENKGHIHFDDFCEIIRLRMESERQRQVKKEIRAAIILQRFHRRRAFRARCRKRKSLFTGKEKFQMSLYKIDALKVLRAKEFVVKEYQCTFKDGPMGFGVDPPPTKTIGSIVTFVSPVGQAMMSGIIRKGDFLIKVGEESVIGLDHKHTVAKIQQATRPVVLTFRRIMSRKQEEARKARHRALTEKHLVKKKRHAQRNLVAQEIVREKERQAELERAKQELQRLKRKQERKEERKRQRQIERDKLKEKAKELNGMQLPKVHADAPRCPICTLSFPCAHYASHEDFTTKSAAPPTQSDENEKARDGTGSNSTSNDDLATNQTIDVDKPLQTKKKTRKKNVDDVIPNIVPKSFSINLEKLQLHETNRKINLMKSKEILSKRLVATPPKRGLNRNSPTKHRVLRKSNSQARFELLDAKLARSQKTTFNTLEQLDGFKNKQKARKDLKAIQHKKSVKIQALYRGFYTRCIATQRKIENGHGVYWIKTCILDQLKQYDVNSDSILDVNELKQMYNHILKVGSNNNEIVVSDNDVISVIKHIKTTLIRQASRAAKQTTAIEHNSIHVDQLVSFVYEEYMFSSRNNGKDKNHQLIDILLKLVETQLVKINTQHAYFTFHLLNYFIYQNSENDGNDVLIDYSYIDYNAFSALVKYFMYTPLSFNTTLAKQCKRIIIGSTAAPANNQTNDVLHDDIEELYTSLLMKSKTKNASKKLPVRYLWNLITNGCKHTTLKKRQKQINTFLTLKYKQRKGQCSNDEEAFSGLSSSFAKDDGILSIVYSEIIRKRAAFIHYLHYIWNAFDINKTGFLTTGTFQNMIVNTYDVCKNELLHRSSVKMPKIMKDQFLRNKLFLSNKTSFLQRCISEIKTEANGDGTLAATTDDSRTKLYRNEFVDFVCNGLRLNYSPPATKKHLSNGGNPSRGSSGNSISLEEYKDNPCYVVYIYRDSIIKFCLWGTIKPNNASIAMRENKRMELQTETIKLNLKKKKKTMYQRDRELARQQNDNNNDDSFSGGKVFKDYREEREVRRKRAIEMHERQIKVNIISDDIIESDAGSDPLYWTKELGDSTQIC